MLRRSQLFVPANNEKKIRKSASIFADSIIFDLEDAVPTEEKGRARDMLVPLIQDIDWGDCEVCVRINKIGSEYSKKDLAMVSSLSKVHAIVLPKTEHISSDLGKTTGKVLIPLIETSKGLLHLESILRTEAVVAVSYGPADFALSVGGRTEAYSRSKFVKTQIVVTASAYGIDAIDGVHFDLSDLEGFRSEAQESRDLGFIGKQVVHPSQVTIANQIYSPTEPEILEAQKVVDAYESSAHRQMGAFRLDGKLVDAVHYRRAKELLERTGKL